MKKKVKNVVSMLLSLSLLTSLNFNYVSAEEYDDMVTNYESYDSLKGDLNGDAFLTAEDHDLMAEYLMVATTDKVQNSDFNNDGTTDVFDMMRLKNKLLVQYDSVRASDEAFFESDNTGSEYYRYSYEGKDYICEIDSEERELIDQINAFRRKYGAREFETNLGNNYFLDKFCTCYKGDLSAAKYGDCYLDDDGKEIPVWEVGGFFYASVSFSYKNSSSSAVLKSLLNNKAGDILSPERTQLAIGHCGSTWKVVFTNIIINAKRDYQEK